MKNRHDFLEMVEGQKSTNSNAVYDMSLGIMGPAAPVEITLGCV